MSKQRKGCWKEGKCGVSRSVQGAGQPQSQHGLCKMMLPFNEFAPAVQGRREGLGLLFCKFNGQTKPWNLWTCSYTTNKDKSKSFAEALKRSKNVFSASEGGLTRRGSAALVLTRSLPVCQHWADPCQFMARLTQPVAIIHQGKSVIRSKEWFHPQD